MTDLKVDDHFDSQGKVVMKKSILPLKVPRLPAHNTSELGQWPNSF